MAGARSYSSAICRAMRASGVILSLFDLPGGVPPVISIQFFRRGYDYVAPGGGLGWGFRQNPAEQAPPSEK